MNNDRGVGHCYSFARVSDLGRSMTPIFLLMVNFLNRFEFFAKCAIEFHSFQLFVHVRDGFKCLLSEGLSFVKMLATYGIIYATDPLLQNLTKIVCLR